MDKHALSERVRALLVAIAGFGSGGICGAGPLNVYRRVEVLLQTHGSLRVEWASGRETGPFAAYEGKRINRVAQKGS